MIHLQNIVGDLEKKSAYCYVKWQVMMTEIVEFRAIMQHLAEKCTIYCKRHCDDTFWKQTRKIKENLGCMSLFVTS